MIQLGLEKEENLLKVLQKFPSLIVASEASSKHRETRGKQAKMTSEMKMNSKVMKKSSSCGYMAGNESNIYNLTF